MQPTHVAFTLVSIIVFFFLTHDQIRDLGHFENVLKALIWKKLKHLFVFHYQLVQEGTDMSIKEIFSKLPFTKRHLYILAATVAILLLCHIISNVLAKPDI